MKMKIIQSYGIYQKLTDFIPEQHASFSDSAFKKQQSSLQLIFILIFIILIYIKIELSLSSKKIF